MARDLTKYSFMGSKKLHKNHLVKAVVSYYLDNNPNATLSSLKDVFPAKSDFDYDMFISEQEYASLNTDRKNRYFKDYFKTKTDEKIYLSNQWGGNAFEDLLKQLKDDFGFDIEAIDNNEDSNFNQRRALFIKIAKHHDLNYQKGKAKNYFQIYPKNISIEGTNGTHYEFIFDKGILYLDIHLEPKAKTDIKQLRQDIKEFSENNGYGFYTNVRPVRIDISTQSDDEIKQTFEKVYTLFQPVIENAYKVDSPIKRAKKLFLNTFPTFTDFNNPGQEYLDVEYNYKVDLLESSKAYLDQMNENNFSALIPNILQSTKEANFIRWTLIDDINNMSNTDKSTLYQLTEQLKKSYENNNLENNFDFIAKGIYDLLKQPSSVVQYITFILFALDQNKHIFIKPTAIDNVLDFFGEEKLISGQLITYKTYSKIISFAYKISQELIEWQPKNMIDIHSFLWVLSKKEKNIYENTHPNVEKEYKMELNTILYGPPGTGKTYETIDKALMIIDGTVPSNRLEAKQRFKSLQESGQIDFVTFHQSYAYEEFIEGIKAINVGDLIKYEITDGVFKNLCEKALGCSFSKLNNIQLTSYIVKTTNSHFILENSNSQKLELSFELISDLINAIDSNHLNLDDILTLSGEDIVEKTGTKYFASFIYRHRPVIHEIINKIKQLNHDDTNQKNFVLIIDEINRGNISKIFGELITLIEPSKRLNGKEELRVRLPYSGKSFGVPSNLYIIGTMNTADRSIALLDTALRRRFKFTEMMPDMELVRKEVGTIGSVNIADLLNTINKRIEVLYDRDHMIGHAYFLDVHKFDDLKDIMKNKIIPLLQEYFYDDWEKIDMIFNGNGFVKSQEVEQELFSEKFELDILDEQKVYSLNKLTLDDPEAYKEIY